MANRPRRTPRPGPPFGTDGTYPPRQRPWPSSTKTATAESAAPQTLQRRFPEDAGSRDALLLFCIGDHMEPFGAAASTLAHTAPGDAPEPPAFPLRAGSVDGSFPAGPNYELEELFRRHVADLQMLAESADRHGGKISAGIVRCSEQF